MTRFDSCLCFVLKMEGGLSDDPADSGGRTNLGITGQTLARARKDGIAKADTVDGLTREVAAAIYRAYYWNACRCGDLPAPVDLAVFDAAVHMGTGTAAMQAQRALNLLGAEPALAEDGIVGPHTLEAARRLPVNIAPALLVVAGSFTLRAFPMPDGQAADLVLSEFTIFSPETQVYSRTTAGDVRPASPSMIRWAPS